MHTVFALLCFVVVIHWLIFPYPSGLLHWHCGNLTIAPVPAKQPWWIWINTSCEFIMNDCITTTKQSTTKPCAYFCKSLHILRGTTRGTTLDDQPQCGRTRWFYYPVFCYISKVLKWCTYMMWPLPWLVNPTKDWNDRKRIYWCNVMYSSPRILISF